MKLVLYPLGTICRWCGYHTHTELAYHPDCLHAMKRCKGDRK